MARESIVWRRSISLGASCRTGSTAPYATGRQLANDTAQGNGLGTLAACADRTVILTGALLGGYASDIIESGTQASAFRSVSKSVSSL
jgi:hypothetical protein